MRKLNDARSRNTQQNDKAGAVSGLPRKDDAQFLTIDLDVRSRGTLAPLVAAWPRAQPAPYR